MAISGKKQKKKSCWPCHETLTSAGRQDTHRRHNVAVDNEEALAVNHIGHHHNLVNFHVGEFERQLGGFNVPGQHHGVRPNELVRTLCPGKKAPGKKK